MIKHLIVLSLIISFIMVCQASSSFPRPQLMGIFCRDVWFPPRGRPTLANLSKEDSAVVWVSINLKLTMALFEKKIFFKHNKVMIWEPQYAPAIQDILKFSNEYKHAVMFMMNRMGQMHSLMDGPRHPCLYELVDFDVALNELHVHHKLVVELNMDAIDVVVKKHEDGALVVEMVWSATAVRSFEDSVQEPTVP